MSKFIQTASSISFPPKLEYFFILFSILVINYDGLLRVANLFILGNEKCNQYLKGKITVNESEICAVAETIGAGPCEVKITFPNAFLGAFNLVISFSEIIC